MTSWHYCRESERLLESLLWLAVSRLGMRMVRTGYKTVESSMAELEIGYDAPA